MDTITERVQFRLYRNALLWTNVRKQHTHTKQREKK